MTSSITPTWTPAADAAELEIKELVIFPHPYRPKSGDMTIGYYLTRRCESVRFRVYTCAFRMIIDESVSSGMAAGQKYTTLPRELFGRLSPGTYYMYVEAEGEGKKARSTISPLVILR